MDCWFFNTECTTKKHRKFVAEPIGDKPVTELPGIGAVLGERLGARGFCEARQVLDQFLKLNKDKAAFQQWLQCVCNANSKQSGDCYHCLREYWEVYMCIP